jgi:hypothetical protein
MKFIFQITAVTVIVASAPAAQEVELTTVTRQSIQLQAEVLGTDTSGVLDLYRAPDGSIEAARLRYPNAVETTSFDCTPGRICLPGVGCFPTDCGGGTLDTGDTIFLREMNAARETVIDGGAMMEAINMRSGISQVITLPLEEQ